MNKTLKIGIIGCGNISKAYFEGLRNVSFLEIVGAADLDQARATAKAAEQRVRAYSIDGLLGDPAIDLIVNLTVPKAHAAVNLSIVRAGKHVYTEKPFALDLNEARQVLDAAKHSSLAVGCAPDTFLGGCIQTTRQLIDGGAIGKPLAAAANLAKHGPEAWHPDPEFFYQPGGGPMLDQGPYFLTALIALLGPIKRAAGSVRASFDERTVGSGAKKGQKIKVNVPTHYACVYDFDSGLIASLNVSFDIWANTLPSIEIYGAEGTIRVPDPGLYGGQVEIRRSDEREWRVMPLTHSDQVRRGFGVVDMASAILHDRPLRASGELAFHVLEAMQAIQVASEQETYVHLKSRVRRPAPLQAGLPQGEVGD